MIQVLPIDFVKPSAYNPRDVDPVRLELVKLSLRKLGFLSPVYASLDGELISGHQRTTAARALGYTHVPVELVDIPDLNTRKAVNILFNRATNDFSTEQTSINVTALLEGASVHELGALLPDMPVNSFPCVDAASEGIQPYVKANRGRWVKYAYNVARSMNGHGVHMPIIVDPDGVVINGIGRLEYAAKNNHPAANFVRLSGDKRSFALAMMNWLSMDFAIEKHYADLLRFNSFRRSRLKRTGLGRGFVFPLVGNKAADTFDITLPKNRAIWKRYFGSDVVDFGAGHLSETTMLREAGVNVVPFEPYLVTGGEQIDRAASISLTREFLSSVASGKVFSSVFLSSVLNSVPFEADRLHIVKICAALCSDKTRVYAVASSNLQTSGIKVDRQFLNESDAATIGTRLTYEPDILMGDINKLPKVQKYHSTAAFYTLFKSAFEVVKTAYDANDNVSAIATRPAPLTGLRTALEFEFDLPYPDGSRMGLVREAISAFEQRLGSVE